MNRHVQTDVKTHTHRLHTHTHTHSPYLSVSHTHSLCTHTVVWVMASKLREKPIPETLLPPRPSSTLRGSLRLFRRETSWSFWLQNVLAAYKRRSVHLKGVVWASCAGVEFSSVLANMAGRGWGLWKRWKQRKEGEKNGKKLKSEIRITNERTFLALCADLIRHVITRM